MCRCQPLDRNAVYALARSLALELSFVFRDRGGVHGERFCRSCGRISQCMSRLQVSISGEICPAMHLFDYDEATAGNGYRSVVSVVDKCVLNIVRLLRFVKEHKGTILFRAGNYCKELEAYCQMLAVFCDAVDLAVYYRPQCGHSELFPDLDKLSDMEQMMRKFESFDQSCFFGRTIGFQFCSSVCRIFRVIAISLASYSLLWERSKYSLTFFAGNLLSCGRWLVNPEERGKRIATCFRFLDPSFCKAFWELLETPLLKHIPRFFGPALHTNEIYYIPGDGCIFLEDSSGCKVEIRPPNAYTGKRPLPVRILSSHPFDGLLGKKAGPSHPKSQKLVFHCHGGGFVATSSKTHETYLKYWAKELGCPVVSVDYSLAPENPFPRAFSEALYAYAWCLTQRDFLGWTGQKICFVGESAGGTLVASLCLKVIELKLPLLPDGLVMIYTPYLLKYAPSPSRLLSLIDPLLSSNVMANLVDAYVPSVEEQSVLDNCDHCDCDGSAVFVKADSPVENKQWKRLTLADYFSNVCKQRRSSPNGRGVEFMLNDDSDRVVNLVHFNNIMPPNSAPKTKADQKHDGVYFSGGNLKTKATSPTYDPLTKTSSLMDDKEQRSTDSIEFLTVHIPENARTIAVSPGAYDEDFLDYLSQNLPSLSDAFTSPREVGSNVVVSPTQQPPSNFAAGHKTEATYRSRGTGGIRRTMSHKFGSFSGLVLDHVTDMLDGAFVSSCYLLSYVKKLDIGSSDDNSQKQRNREDSGDVSSSRFMQLVTTKNLVNDPLLSPMLASDAALSRFPLTKIIACQLDPLLDDSITFAKKLRKLNVAVSLDLIDSLPHGFLNLISFSAECKEGADLCIKRIKQCFDVP